MTSLKSEIEELLYDNATDLQIAKVLKKDIKIYFDTLEHTFVSSKGKDFLVKHTKKIDSLLKMVYKVALRSMFGDYMPMKNSVPLALVALGSYGREQLCVHSDIDLMIVYKEVSGYNTKEMIEKILYILWDTGLKLGHRVHTTDELYEVSKTDITIKTALIESRMIEGSGFVWTDTQNAIDLIRHDNIKGFIEQKRQEQERKHLKYPLTMEPNLKEGVGGFRDANLVYWIGKILYNVNNIRNLPSEIIDDKEYRTFRMALEFMFQVRSALHLVAKKKEDKLRLEILPEVSILLGYNNSKNGQMKFAKKVTESLKIIRLYTSIWIERLSRKYIPSNKAQMLCVQENKSKDFKALLTQLCHKAKEPFEAHPTFLEALITAYKPERPNQEMYEIIYELFSQKHSYSILFTLSCARLLKYTIAPIRKVVDLPQFDGYHQYAVDIHSLRCVYHLENIQDTFILSLRNSLSPSQNTMLKLATFLHDAGKGRKRDHHFVGASLFKVFAHKLGMNEAEIRMGETLITYHTLMSKVAQREDLYSEKVIMAFASHFPSLTLLNMIYILTYADMSGVGGEIYNSFSAKLLRTLYNQSLEALAHPKLLNEAQKRAKKELSLSRNEQFKLLKKSQQKKIFQIPSNLIFLRYKTQRILDISLKGFQTQDYSYHISNEKYLTLEIIRKDNFNLGYLLAKLAQLDLVNMDICKLFDGLKYFKIDFSQSIDTEEIPRLEHIIDQAFKQKSTQTDYSVKIKKEEIDIDCSHSKTYALMQLNASNQKGLLAFVIDMFDTLGIDIVTAKIHTLKNRARDMFLIEKNGNFCKNVPFIIEKLSI